MTPTLFNLSLLFLAFSCEGWKSFISCKSSAVVDALPVSLKGLTSHHNDKDTTRGLRIC